MIRKITALSLIALLFVGLLLPTQSYSGNCLVASGSVTQANMRISAVNGTSFVDFGAANVLTSKLGNLIVIKDSSGHSIQGWIKAAGSGETLDDELVTDGKMDTAIGAGTWTTPGNWSIGAGVATYDDLALNYMTQNLTAISNGLFKTTFDIGTATGRFAVTDQTGNSSFVTADSGREVGSYTVYRTRTTATTAIRCYGFTNDSSFTLDNLSIKQVLTPSATGVTIVSTKGGTTYNFSAKDSAFNYNDASGYTYFIYKTPAVLIANGTFTAANARNSFDATTAFCEANGLDLSPYAGTDAGSTPFLIELEDASGDVAWGFGGAVGGGEALTEKITNGTFDSGSSWIDGEWVIEDGVIKAVDLGYTQNAYQAGALGTPSLGKLYKTSYDISSFVKGSVRIGASFSTTNRSGNGTYVEYKVQPGTDAAIYIMPRTAIGGTTLNVDNLSVKNVTDCAATGLHIMSARNGTTRGWKTIGANFGVNDAMKFRIYFLGN